VLVHVFHGFVLGDHAEARQHLQAALGPFVQIVQIFVRGADSKSVEDDILPAVLERLGGGLQTDEISKCGLGHFHLPRYLPSLCGERPPEGEQAGRSVVPTTDTLVIAPWGRLWLP
jgi:hypothetical protein